MFQDRKIHINWSRKKKIIIIIFLILIIFIGGYIFNIHNKQENKHKKLFVTSLKVEHHETPARPKSNDNSLSVIINKSKFQDALKSYSEEKIEISSNEKISENKEHEVIISDIKESKEKYYIKYVDKKTKFSEKPVKEINIPLKKEQNPVSSFKTLSGNVVKGGTDEPIAGVSVGIDGTPKGILTDINGFYSINVDTSVKVLTYNYPGYESKNMEVNEPEKLVRLIKKYRSKNDSSEANQFTKKQANESEKMPLLEVSENDFGLLLYKAMQTAREGDTLKAISEINEILNNNKRYVQAWNELAKLSLIRLDKKAAVKALKKINTVVTVEKLKKNISEIIKLTEKEKFNDALTALAKLKLEKQY